MKAARERAGAAVEAAMSPELERVLGTGRGVLASQHLQAVIKAGVITADHPVFADQIQPASLDLRLGAKAYRVRAGFLPGPKATVMEKLEPLKRYEFDLSGGAVLEAGHVYIIPLQESLRLPAGLRAKANPKSTTGRLDVFTRLITDYGEDYEDVAAGYAGPLYAEVMPLTFSVRVAEGSCLNQLRLLKGVPEASDAGLKEYSRKVPLVYVENDKPQKPEIDDGLWLSVDLKGIAGAKTVGWKARKNTPDIDLGKIGHYDPLEFWEPILRPAAGGLVLHPGDFYILSSREKVRIPPEYAASMVEYDPGLGEFRVHYAGFFDPGFGFGSNEIKGTNAVLEVRCHEVPFLLEDGQVVGRLRYERVLEPPTKVYGVGIGSSYQQQGLALSKQFKRPG